MGDTVILTLGLHYEFPGRANCFPTFLLAQILGQLASSSYACALMLITYSRGRKVYRVYMAIPDRM